MTHDEIKRLLEGITPDEWWIGDTELGEDYCRSVGPEHEYNKKPYTQQGEVEEAQRKADCDAAFMQAAPSIVRQLLEEVEKLDIMERYQYMMDNKYILENDRLTKALERIASDESWEEGRQTIAIKVATLITLDVEFIDKPEDELKDKIIRDLKDNINFLRGLLEDYRKKFKDGKWEEENKPKWAFHSCTFGGPVETKPICYKATCPHEAPCPYGCKKPDKPEQKPERDAKQSPAEEWMLSMLGRWDAYINQAFKKRGVQ
jgi:hypothetical protein